MSMNSAAYLKHIGELPALLIKADMDLMSAEVKRAGISAAETANLKSKINLATDLYISKATDEFSRAKRDA
jgi:hypothetical protein